MALIGSWRVPRGEYLSFGNSKKSQGAKSGEYDGWAMTFVLCLAKNSVTMRLECDWALLLSGGDALDTQNITHNCVIDRVDSPKYFCNISNDSGAVIPLETPNFKQTHSILFFHSKNRQTNFSRRKPVAAKHALMDVSCSNFTRLSKKVLLT